MKQNRNNVQHLYTNINENEKEGSEWINSIQWKYIHVFDMWENVLAIYHIVMKRYCVVTDVVDKENFMLF